MSRLAPVALVTGAFLSAPTTVLINGCVGFRPKLIRLDERVQNRQQLSHGGGQGDFLEFALLQQTLVERLETKKGSGLIELARSGC